MKNGLFYTGISLLFTHELDAMTNHEWRVLPLTSFLDDQTGEVVFTLAHIPLFALVIGLIASLNVTIREKARAYTCGFLILHAGLHAVFSGHVHYEFTGVMSNGLIYGAAICGILYFAVVFHEKRSSHSSNSPNL